MKEEITEPADEDLNLSFEDEYFFEKEEEYGSVSDFNDMLESNSVQTIHSRDDYFDATRVYLNELGRSKLLTADQEKAFHGKGRGPHRHQPRP